MALQLAPSSAFVREADVAIASVPSFSLESLSGLSWFLSEPVVTTAAAAAAGCCQVEEQGGAAGAGETALPDGWDFGMCCGTVLLHVPASTSVPPAVAAAAAASSAACAAGSRVAAVSKSQANHATHIDTELSCALGAGPAAVGDFQQVPSGASPTAQASGSGGGDPLFAEYFSLLAGGCASSGGGAGAGGDGASKQEGEKQQGERRRAAKTARDSDPDWSAMDDDDDDAAAAAAAVNFVDSDDDDDDEGGSDAGSTQSRRRRRTATGGSKRNKRATGAADADGSSTGPTPEELAPYLKEFPWPAECLHMSTKNLNAFLKRNNFSDAEAKRLKVTRRRIKNCVYAKNARFKRKETVANLSEVALTREQLQKENAELRKANSELQIQAAEMHDWQRRFLELQAIAKQHGVTLN
jgi:hypothetical protein